MPKQNEADSAMQLETRLAWMDRLVNQLNEVVIEQQKRITSLEQRLRRLEEAGSSE